MKNPLHYQLTEYDCGPTSILNGISYLFGREEIRPEILRQTMLISLDCYGAGGRFAEYGTSCTAMMFLSNWFNSYGAEGNLPVYSAYLRGGRVNFSDDSELRDALEHGGVAVVRLYLENPHYVLLTGIEGERVYVFDPYYMDEPIPGYDEIAVDLSHPFSYNRVVPTDAFDVEDTTPYAFGERAQREAILFFNRTITELPQTEPDYTVRDLAAGAGRLTF